MEDRNAFVENTVRRGVNAEDLKNREAFRGMPAEEYAVSRGLRVAPPPHRGLPEAEARGLVQKTDYFINPKPVTCSGKEGTCKARPVKGTQLCIGHTRQSESRTDKG